MPQDFITRKVLEEIKSLPGFPKLRIVDLSCGEGEILSILSSQGCDVIGTHFREGDYIIEQRKHLEGLTIIDEVDLHKTLPFTSGSFDVVLLTEVIEHLESYHSVIREAGRILKPNGYLVLTTPNTYRMHSRLQFLLRGHHKLIQRRLSWDLQKEDLYANHISMVNFPLLHTLLYQGRLQIDHLFTTRVKVQHLYIAPLYPVQWLITRLGGVRKRKRSLEAIRGYRDQNKWMTQPAMAFSEQLALVAQKRT